MILPLNSTSPRSCEWMSPLDPEDAGLNPGISFKERQGFVPDVRKSLTSLAQASLCSLNSLCSYCSHTAIHMMIRGKGCQSLVNKMSLIKQK